MHNWSPESWQRFPNQQPLPYLPTAPLKACADKLAEQSPLISPETLLQLQQLLTEAALGKRFLIQIGDCAESFADDHALAIAKKVALLLQLGVCATHKLHKKAILVGRMAGQFAKPRSAATETQNSITLPSYYGDLINGHAFSADARLADPTRLLHGYAFAERCLSLLSHLQHECFTQALHAPDWGLLKPQSPTLLLQLEKLLLNAKTATTATETIPIFTSHEAFHLNYEQALTRKVNGKWFNLATHFPWIGMRTLALNSAHVEYARGIANPIALKIGPQLDALELQNLLRLLNPQREPGRLVLIHRLGLKHIEIQLPKLIAAVKATQIPVLWSCDPMHGNTHMRPNGNKVRYLSEIKMELEQAFAIHANCDSQLAGLHLEVTIDAVTECLSTPDVNEMVRQEASTVDPRLNFDQSLELVLGV